MKQRVWIYNFKFMESTDDIDLFVETIIVDMNVGYENSNIPVRVKVKIS